MKPPYTVNYMLLAALAVAAVAVADHNTPAALEARTAPVGKLNVVDAATLAAAAASSEPRGGEEVYDAVCATCHDSGLAGAPTIGDEDDWSARLAQGMAVLVEHAINGFTGDTGVMIARGGDASLTDDEVAAAVEYIIDESQ